MVNPERPAAIAARQVDEGQYWQTFLGADLGLIDPDTDAIIGFEEERQARKLIMIPSESIARGLSARRWAPSSTTSMLKGIRPCA